MKSAPQYGSGKSRSTAVRHYALLCICKSSRLARELLRGMWQTSHTAWAMWIGLTESHSAGGTASRQDVKRSGYSGPGGHDRNTAPEYFGLTGAADGPLRRRHSGKGRAVPERPPVDPPSLANQSGGYRHEYRNGS